MIVDYSVSQEATLVLPDGSVFSPFAMNTYVVRIVFDDGHYVFIGLPRGSRAHVDPYDPPFKEELADEALRRIHTPRPLDPERPVLVCGPDRPMRA
jgi:hypothetical protein